MDDNANTKSSESGGPTLGRFLSPKFFVVFLLIFILIISFYLFRYKILNLDIEQDDSVSTIVPNQSDMSVFDELVDDDYNESERKLLDFYKNYSLGNQGIPYIFKDFDENTMEIDVSKVNSDEINSYKLGSDFVIICTKYDPTKSGLDFSRWSDSYKISISRLVSETTVVKRVQLLNDYAVGEGLGIVFNNDGDINGENLATVKKLLLISADPDSCY